MKIKFFSAFLACAFLSVVTVSAVGCASDKNNSGNQEKVEYSKPVHVSRSVKSQRVYAASANEKTRAGVIKPYSTNTSSVKSGVVKPYSNSSNNVKKENNAYLHSEDNLNNLGYEYLNKNENEKALEIFKLNVLLNPSSGNAYDSYGEVLLKMNKKEDAIKMYKKSIELNPENENGKKVINELSKQ